MLNEKALSPKIPLSYLERMVNDHEFMGMMEVFLTLKAFAHPVLTHKQAVAILKGNHVSRYKINKYLPKLIAAKFIGQSKSVSRKRTLYLRGAKWMIEEQGKNAVARFVSIPSECLANGAMTFKAHICNLAVKMLATRVYYQKAVAQNRECAEKYIETVKTLCGVTVAEKVAKGKRISDPRLPKRPDPVPCRVQDVTTVPFSLQMIRRIAPNKSKMTWQRIRARAVSVGDMTLKEAYEPAPKNYNAYHVANNFNWTFTREMVAEDWRNNGRWKFWRLRWKDGRLQHQLPSELSFTCLPSVMRKAYKGSSLWAKKSEKQMMKDYERAKRACVVR